MEGFRLGSGKATDETSTGPAEREGVGPAVVHALGWLRDHCAIGCQWHKGMRQSQRKLATAYRKR